MAYYDSKDGEYSGNLMNTRVFRDSINPVFKDFNTFETNAGSDFKFGSKARARHGAASPSSQQSSFQAQSLDYRVIEQRYREKKSLLIKQLQELEELEYMELQLAYQKKVQQMRLNLGPES